MKSTTPSLPGLYYRREPVRAAASLLRSDVAGFIGRTRWGNVGVATRVEGWREFASLFGPLDQDAPLSFAAYSYFENGGEVAYIVRVVGEDTTTATGDWNLIGIGASYFSSTAPSTARTTKHLIRATSPGIWADRLRVSIRYCSDSSPRRPMLKFFVHVQGEPSEQFNVPIPDAIPPHSLSVNQAIELEVASRSRFIRLQTDESLEIDQVSAASGRMLVDFDDIVLGAQPETAVAIDQYRDGLRVLGDEPEVAIVAMPGLSSDLTEDDHVTLFCEATYQAAALQDRLVIVDVLRDDDREIDFSTDRAIQFANTLRNRIPEPSVRRAAAIYHPWVRTQDPLGGNAVPLRTMPPSGHVAGVIARIDRERGAYYTPANVPVNDAVDVETSFDVHDSGLLSAGGINLIRNLPGRGPILWGGRTLDLSREGRFLGQRRFIHRLIRVMRRVTEPLIFDTNGPQLWLVLLQSLGTVLLEAFRSGALQGDRPEEAFQIRCDARTNPITEREEGRVNCEVDLALSAPMEFITLRVSLSHSGQLEVFDE